MNRRTRFRIFMRDDFTCQYCGRKAPDTELHVDHVHPKSKGGPDTDENFKTACIDCNSGKSNIVVFAPKPPEFTFVNGPKDGLTVRRRDKYPIEWGWVAADGRRFWLNDAGAEVDGAWLERVLLGPSPYTRHEHPVASAIIEHSRALRGIGTATPAVWLDGAYFSNGYVEELGYGEMIWMPPHELLMRLDFKHPDESAMNSILDP